MSLDHLRILSCLETVIWKTGDSNYAGKSSQNCTFPWSSLYIDIDPCVTRMWYTSCVQGGFVVERRIDLYP